MGKYVYLVVGVSGPLELVLGKGNDGWPPALAESYLDIGVTAVPEGRDPPGRIKGSTHGEPIT
jgi:hypothetical protein